MGAINTKQNTAIDTHTYKRKSQPNTTIGGFPGGSVVKNPPANAGHLALIPGTGKSHML